LPKRRNAPMLNAQRAQLKEPPLPFIARPQAPRTSPPPPPSPSPRPPPSLLPPLAVLVSRLLGTGSPRRCVRAAGCPAAQQLAAACPTQRTRGGGPPN
jgi:hypothetical protein